MSSFLTTFLIISALMASMNIFIGIKSLHKGTRQAKDLAFCCYFGAAVTVTYALSVALPGCRTASACCSLYFICIDLMLMNLYDYTIRLTSMKVPHGLRMLNGILQGYMLFDVAVMCVNPFWNIAVIYGGHPRDRMGWQMLPLYGMHLVFSYVLIVLVLVFIIRRMTSVPDEYKMIYLLHVVGILIVVVSNAAFLFVQNNPVFEGLDVSVLMYSVITLFFYLAVFVFSKRTVHNRLRARVFANVSQGIIMFDFDNRLALWNKRAEKLLPDVNFAEGMELESLIKMCRFPLDYRNTPNEFSFQFYTSDRGKLHPLRCEYYPQRNDNGQIIGQMLILTDAALESDMLTGFQNWDSFRQLVEEYPDSYHYPAVVVMADISGMTDINNSLGRQTGDRMLAELADLFRTCFPKNVFFVRGPDGRLIAITRGYNETNAKKCIMEVKKAFSGHFVYAIAATTDASNDLMKAIGEAERGLKTWKLMDTHSHRSEVLNSLIREMSLRDPDTENHIRRTQAMAAELGSRMNLSDINQGKLSLLCMLHDIGKIGIPQEIYNKTGRLTEAEWQIVQSHVFKGQQIVKSSEEFAAIADLILYHHERWDGLGYPDGLSKESIPLLSRMIAVIDGYDELVTAGAHHQPLSREAAIEELRSCAGKQYDPSVTAEFIRMMQETKVIPDTAGAEDAKPSGLLEAPGKRALAPDRVHVLKYSRYTANAKMQIISSDEQFEKMTGYTREDIAAGELTQMKLIPQEDQTEYLTMLTQLLAASDRVYCEHRLCRKDGSIINVLCFGRNYYSAENREQRTDIIITDSEDTYAVQSIMTGGMRTDEKRQARWEEKYRCDSLTGLLTHEALRNDTEERLLAGQRCVMMIMMDLDHFKQYNDTHGHMAGDELLKTVAKEIQRSVGESSLACRMGGDEFAAVCFFPEGTDFSEMRAFGERVFGQVTAVLKQVSENTGVSMGTAFGNEQTKSFNDLYLAADQELYESKEHGRGRISFGGK